MLKFKFKKEDGITVIEIILIILVFAILFNVILNYNSNNIYVNPNVDKNSEWYVNDLYLSDQYYYKNILNDQERKYYKQIFNNIKNMDKEIEYSYGTSTMLKVMDAIICDHPELINLAGFLYTEEKIKFNYLDDNENGLNEKIKRIQKEISKISKEIKNMQSDYEKEKYIYEWLGGKSRYGRQFDHSDQSAYTAFADFEETVCAGFAKAAQILLQNFGVKSHLIINENHIWNMVELDDEYYYFDATCTYVSNELYLVSYKGLNQNIETSNYNSQYLKFFPKVTGQKYNYYDYEGKTIKYDKNNLENILNILETSETQKVEIKISNASEFEKDIRSLQNRLDVKYIGCYGDYMDGCGVFLIYKND